MNRCEGGPHSIPHPTPRERHIDPHEASQCCRILSFVRVLTELRKPLRYFHRLVAGFRDYLAFFKNSIETATDMLHTGLRTLPEASHLNPSSGLPRK